ncbi:NADPH-dependent FMN reductase [Paraburkholderia sp. GAS348]|jgi:FMN reductase|uniref:NADPH-dependent FMN reductase n=1 Tax=Paraburkholderia sp. GAS348 TaxID=3035132 RepID=UPI003D213D29
MQSINASKPFIVGLGGTARPDSSTEKALAIALSSAERAGARVQLIGSDLLTRLPHYLTTEVASSPEALALLDALRRADGVIIASPGYHGSVSGILKNAIDYLEETARDDRAYLHDIPVGLIATAYGWQATSSTLATLRTIVHALRGWPTPLGAAVNSSGGIFSAERCSDAKVIELLETVGQQVVEFALMKCRSLADSERTAALETVVSQ